MRPSASDAGVAESKTVNLRARGLATQQSADCNLRQKYDTGQNIALKALKYLPL